MGYENRIFHTNTKVVFHLFPRVAYFISVKCLLKFFYLTKGVVNLYPHFKASRPCKLQF